MKALVFAALIIASPLEAQGGFLTAPDRWRERQAWIPQSIDSQDWQTWGWHGALTWGLGGIIGATTPFSAREGRHVLAAFYVVREVAGLIVGNRKYFDAAMDAVVPVVVARIRF